MKLFQSFSENQRSINFLQRKGFMSGTTSKSTEYQNMLTAIILELQPINESILPISHGVFVYAAALDLIGRLDPNLPRLIHDPAKSKPITISPVWGAFREETILKLYQNETYQWRLTGLDEISSACLSRISPDLGIIRIGDANFKIVNVQSDAYDDSDSGQATYASILTRWRDVQPPIMFPLEFRTPTTFRRGEFEDPFPAPHLVFGSLLNAWNAHSPEKLDDVTPILRELIILSNWKGETRRVELGSRRTVGFIGRFTYRVVENLPEVCRLLGLLVEYAFYSGVGWQTTHGLGQIRLIKNL